MAAVYIHQPEQGYSMRTKGSINTHTYVCVLSCTAYNSWSEQKSETKMSRKQSELALPLAPQLGLSLLFLNIVLLFYSRILPRYFYYSMQVLLLRSGCARFIH